MSVPQADLLCYFIRPGEGRWNARENRPHQSAFRARAHQLSVWHLTRLSGLNATPTDLCFGSLEGSGQAHHTAGDYKAFAAEIAECVDEGFSVAVEWRDGDNYANPEWHRWKEAHAQAESKGGEPNFPLKYRVLLALRCRAVIPPLHS